MSNALQDYLKWADRYLNNTTEMEANARVLLLVLDAVHHCDDMVVNLQPSVDDHPDFSFITKSEGNPLSLIEVKKVDIYTNLSTETSSTAQLSTQGGSHFAVHECFS